MSDNGKIAWTNEKRRLGDLIPWEDNPRQITKEQAERLERSISKFGYSQPIEIEPDNTVIDGHQRKPVMLLIKEFGSNTEIDVRVASRQMTLEERKEYVALKHEGATGEWDWDGMHNLYTTDELMDFGFDADKLEYHGFEFDIDEPEPDPGAQIDRAEELREKWGVEIGQLWRLGEHRLICGDCTDAEVVARAMEGERAGCAWFDPPFGIDLKPQRGLNEPIENDNRAQAMKLWERFLPILHENLTTNANVFLCQFWTEFDWSLPLIKKHFTLKSKVVWNKNVWGIGYYTRPKHEDIIYCWKGEPEKPSEPVADVWDVAREGAPEHAAEKPPELSGIAIDHFSNNGDVVVDWFCGVGGSLIACERLGRKCRAVEISPAYCAVAIQRWVDMTGGEPELVEPVIQAESGD